MRYFRLLKDLPDLKAGEIFSRPIDEGYKGLRDDENEYMYVRRFGDGYDEGTWFDGDCVKNNTEWFEEVWKCDCGHFQNMQQNDMLGMCNKCYREKQVKKQKIELLEEIPALQFSAENMRIKNKINEIIEYINKNN